MKPELTQAHKEAIRLLQVCDNTSQSGGFAPTGEQLALYSEEFAAMVEQGKAEGDDAKALLACTLKAAVDMTSKWSNSANVAHLLHKITCAEPSKEQKELLESDLGQNEKEGLYLAIRDYLLTRYGDPMGVSVMNMIAHPGYQSPLIEMVRKTGVNPFADLCVAVIGGKKKFMRDAFPLQELMGSFVNYDEESGTPLYLHHFERGGAEPAAFDYVVSGNVLNEYLGYGREKDENVAAIFSASANLLKKEGKAFHVIAYMGGEYLNKLLNFGLAPFAGTEMVPIPGAPLENILAFTKTDDRQITVAQHEAFMKGWFESQASVDVDPFRRIAQRERERREGKGSGGIVGR